METINNHIDRTKIGDIYVTYPDTDVTYFFVFCKIHDNPPYEIWEKHEFKMLPDAFVDRVKQAEYG